MTKKEKEDPNWRNNKRTRVSGEIYETCLISRQKKRTRKKGGGTGLSPQKGQGKGTIQEAGV